MEQLKLTGQIKRISDIQQITDTFRKREFVITTDEQYPQTVLFEMVQDKVSLIDPFSEGQIVDVFFNVSGREWQRDAQSEVKVFVSLKAWRIQPVGEQQQGSAPSGSSSASSAPKDTSSFDTDLPF